MMYAFPFLYGLVFWNFSGKTKPSRKISTSSTSSSDDSSSDSSGSSDSENEKVEKQVTHFGFIFFISLFQFLTLVSFLDSIDILFSFIIGC